MTARTGEFPTTGEAALLRPEVTRDRLKALWLHRAVAGRLVADPDGVLSKARANLDRMRRVHRDGMAAMWLDRSAY
jgi:hypothetical protein